MPRPLLIGLLVFGVPLVGWLTASVITHQRYLATRAPSTERIRQLDETARKVASTMTTTTTALDAACEGTLSHAPPSAFLLWWGPPPSSITDLSLGWPANQLTGFGHTLKTTPLAFLPFDPSADTTELSDWLLKGPSEWATERESHLDTRPWVESARYLLVHRIEALSPPKLVDDEHAESGSATVLVTVVDVASQKPLCHGAVTFAPEIKIMGHGRGSTKDLAKSTAEIAARKGVTAAFAQGLGFSALLDLCELGGAELCAELNARTTTFDEYY